MDILKKQNKRQVYYNAKIKHYIDGKTQTTVCKQPIFKSKFDEKIKNQIDENNINLSNTGNKKILEYLEKKERTNEIRLDSLKRARDSVFDIVYNNDWDYFLTITFDSKLISDRYDSELIKNKVKKWLDNMVARKGLKYILVPEFHKDGAIHCHALTNKAFKLVDSTKKTNGKTIYNVQDWKYGFSTAIEVTGDKQSLSFYITKYLTKDSNKIFGKYYYSSRNIIKKCTFTYENIDYDSINKAEYGSFKYISDFSYEKG